jgi:hypothetical protein
MALLRSKRPDYPTGHAARRQSPLAVRDACSRVSIALDYRDVAAGDRPNARIWCR